MERKPEQISRDIAAFERKLSEAGDNQVLKEALTKRIKKLKDELKGGSQSTKQLAYTLLGARKKVKELAAKDFRALMLRLSKKSEYDFLKRYSAAKAKDDMERKAKPVGYRFKGRGNYDTPTKREISKGLANKTVYYEGRPRRSDVSQVIQLAKGGGVESQYKKGVVLVKSAKASNDNDVYDILNDKWKKYKIVNSRAFDLETPYNRGWIDEGISINVYLLKDTKTNKYYWDSDYIEARKNKMATGGGLEKYPELRKIADEIADETAEKINKRVEKINSKMPYKAQWVLEEVVRDLENRI